MGKQLSILKVVINQEVSEVAPLITLQLMDTVLAPSKRGESVIEIQARSCA